MTPPTRPTTTSPHRAARGARAVPAAFLALFLVLLVVAGACSSGSGGPTRVALYGDSLVYDSSKYWLDMMREAGDYEVKQTSYPGTNTCDAFTAMERDAEEYEPDVVALAYGGNDGTPCILAADGSRRSRPDFLDRFRRDTERALDIFDDDVTIYLFAPPVMPEHTEREIHEIYRDLAADRPNVRYRDGGRLVSPDHTWVEHLPCLPEEVEADRCTGPVVDGVQTNVVRAWDGVHFCPVNPGWGKPCKVYASGAFRYARTLAEGITGDDDA